MLDGKVTGRCMQQHRHQKFIRFVNTVEAAVPAGNLIHAIADNYATHKHRKVRRWLARPSTPGVPFCLHLPLMAQCRGRLFRHADEAPTKAQRLPLSAEPPTMPMCPASCQCQLCHVQRRAMPDGCAPITATLNGLAYTLEADIPIGASVDSDGSNLAVAPVNLDGAVTWEADLAAPGRISRPLHSKRFRKRVARPVYCATKPRTTGR